MFKKIGALMVVLTLSALTMGCNTMSGVGQDIEWTGERIQGASEQMRPR